MRLAAVIENSMMVLPFGLVGRLTGLGLLGLFPKEQDAEPRIRREKQTGCGPVVVGRQLASVQNCGNHDGRIGCRVPS